MKIPTSSYWLDNRDYILSVSGSWDEFADENGGVQHTETSGKITVADFVCEDCRCSLPGIGKA